MGWGRQLIGPRGATGGCAEELFEPDWQEADDEPDIEGSAAVANMGLLGCYTGCGLHSCLNLQMHVLTQRITLPCICVLHPLSYTFSSFTCVFVSYFVSHVRHLSLCVSPVAVVAGRKTSGRCDSWPPSSRSMATR